MTFRKGQSGNPGGRPKVKLPDGRTLTEIAREHTPKAVQTLVAVLDSAEASEAAKVSAATAILDRGWGRPRQDLGIEMKPDEATAALLEQARRRANRLPVEGLADALIREDRAPPPRRALDAPEVPAKPGRM
jgi:hypothetical protein